MDNNIKKIAVCIPTYNTISSVFFVWFSETLEIWRKKYYVKVFTISTQPVDYARNKLINLVLTNDEKFDFIFFIDSDNFFSPDYLDILIKHDLDIVSGLYFARVHPYNPVAFKSNGQDIDIIRDFKLGELMEVDSIGLGCCLIKPEVFTKLKFPYFKFEISNNEKGLKYMSEDRYFCKLAKEAGFSVFLDTKVLCRHYGADVGIEHNQFLANF
jgi:hypothetical protein